MVWCACVCARDKTARLLTPGARRAGRYEFYSEQLQSAENAEGYADQTQAYVRRRLFDANYTDQNYTFGTATARRLSELADGDFVVPAFDSQGMTSALDDLMLLVITIGSSLFDLFFGLLGEFLSSGFAFIVDAIWMLLRRLMTVVKFVVKSGLLPIIIGIGIDIVVIGLTELLLPAFFAIIDAIKCIVDLFTPDGWGAQLQCVEDHCFRGADAGADFLVFWSTPILLHRFAAVADATINSRTGRRFFNSAPTSGYTTGDRTVDPETGQPIGAEDAPSTQTPNPVLDFEFADITERFVLREGAEMCGSCFNCRVPELRLVWVLIASIGSLVSSHNVATFVGNVTRTCLTNGSWYWEACGPLPASGDVMLPWSEWSAQPWAYDAGFHELDARIVSSFASTLQERAEELGQADLSPESVLWIQAATAWMEDRDDAVEQRAAAFTYHACRVARAEARANRGEEYLTPQDFFTHASGSFERYSTHYLYTTCRRFKYEIFSDVGRAAHALFYDVAACAQDKVTCKKQELECRGSCAGVDGTAFNHDFATIVSLTELDEELLGTDAFEASAADCNVRTHVFHVPTFEGGDSFKTVFARLQSRSAPCIRIH